eukprot:GHVQ01026855.1.p1 GENE.GHVQ01026855.1~~GHVQ01026855.1.p1  ORF type:complete len:440 (-),score=41.15 GHVQ01026855.1:61-1236(-)
MGIDDFQAITPEQELFFEGKPPRTGSTSLEGSDSVVSASASPEAPKISLERQPEGDGVPPGHDSSRPPVQSTGEKRSSEGREKAPKTRNRKKCNCKYPKFPWDSICNNKGQCVCPPDTFLKRSGGPPTCVAVHGWGLEYYRAGTTGITYRLCYHNPPGKDGVLTNTCTTETLTQLEKNLLRGLCDKCCDEYVQWKSHQVLTSGCVLNPGDKVRCLVQTYIGAKQYRACKSQDISTPSYTTNSIDAGSRVGVRNSASPFLTLGMAVPFTVVVGLVILVGLFCFIFSRWRSNRRTTLTTLDSADISQPTQDPSETMPLQSLPPFHPPTHTPTNEHSLLSTLVETMESNVDVNDRTRKKNKRTAHQSNVDFELKFDTQPKHAHSIKINPKRPGK